MNHYITMKRAFILFLFPVFAVGVFGESVSVKEGDSVTLHTDVTEIKTDEEIEWRFNSSRIARMIKNDAVYDNDVKFRDRLKMDIQTGDLKITDFRITDSGLYKLEINSPRVSSEMKFSVSGVSYSGVNSVSVLEGDSVILHTDVSEIQSDDVIQWRFEHRNPPVAEINRKAIITSDGPDGRFKDILQVDHWTGSLTIRNIGTKHSGFYEVGIRSGSSRYTTHTSFNVTVSGSGLSPAAVAGIVGSIVVILLAAAVVIALVVIHHRRRIAKLKRQRKNVRARMSKLRNAVLFITEEENL